MSKQVNVSNGKSEKTKEELEIEAQELQKRNE